MKGLDDPYKSNKGNSEVQKAAKQDITKEREQVKVLKRLPV
jgi:hypothetical protein